MKEIEASRRLAVWLKLHRLDRTQPSPSHTRVCMVAERPVFF